MVLYTRGVSEHREVEHTYAPGPDAEPPDLTALPGVADVGDPETVDLCAVYFDTADLALLRAGVTLRRRTGGGDEGWHLKLPAEVGREEIRWALGSARRAPPRRLLQRTRAWTRGAPVVPVATIETQRTERALRAGDGTVLAELADDRVTATAEGSQDPVSWREWELELVAGELDLLEAADDVMAAAGVSVSTVGRKILHVLGDRVAEQSPPRVRPKGPARDVLQRRLAEQVADLLRRDSQVRGGSAEGVHQARVACRRLRGALATYRPLVDRTVTDPLRDELQWLGRELAGARDAKVVRQRLAGLLDEEPAGLVGRVERARLRSTYDGRARVAQAEVLEVLESDRYFALLDGLVHLVDEPPWTEVADRRARDVLPKRVRRDFRRLARSVAALEEAPERDPAMHQARKDAKRLRYAAETLEPVWGKDARRLAKAAKELTAHLGDRQDTVVSRQHLVEIAREADAAGESDFTWGRLHAREEARAEQYDRDFERVWHRASRKRLRAWLR